MAQMKSQNRSFPPQCNKDCGGGRQYRKVRCRQLLALGEVADKPDGQCPFPRPRDAASCNLDPCGSYDYEKWARERDSQVAAAAEVMQVRKYIREHDKNL